MKLAHTQESDIQMSMTTKFVDYQKKQIIEISHHAGVDHNLRIWVSNLQSLKKQYV